MALGTLGAHKVARDPPLHRLALGLGERLQHVLPRTGERPHVARLLLPLDRAARLRRGVAGVDRDRGHLLGVEDPFAVLLRRLAPRAVHAVAQGDEDVAQVLAVSRRRPPGDRALTDGERVVRHHRLLGDVVDPAQIVTSYTCLQGSGEDDSC